VGIPFRDAEDVGSLGAAAYLKVEPVGGGTALRGALFLISARGEPLEFAYNRVQLPETFLWRRAELRRHAERKLVASLLTICGRMPRLLLCLAEEVGSELFCQEIQVELPVARIGPALQALPYAAVEVEEVLEQALPELDSPLPEAAPERPGATAARLAAPEWPGATTTTSPEWPGAASTLPPGPAAPGAATLPPGDAGPAAEPHVTARLHLFWYPAPPAPESAERRLVDRLSSRGLLLEPFERATVGLVEVYGAEEA
jgi:hypothetical protein